MTIYEEALKGNITNEMIGVAKEENRDVNKLIKDIVFLIKEYRQDSDSMDLDSEIQHVVNLFLKEMKK